jgi:DNA-binding MarR family transcriptional regulator
MRLRDHADSVLEQWQQARPDLDAHALGIAGRILRLANLMEHRTNDVLAEFDLALWEFDVLGTLRRQGKPYTLTPTALMAATLLSSGAMTNRINRLEERGFVERTPSTADRRSFQISLTAKGLRAIDAAAGPRFSDAAEAIEQLSAKERSTLADLLRKLTHALEPNYRPSSSGLGKTEYSAGK